MLLVTVLEGYLPTSIGHLPVVGECLCMLYMVLREIWLYSSDKKSTEC